VDYGCTT